MATLQGGWVASGWGTRRTSLSTLVAADAATSRGAQGQRRRPGVRAHCRSPACGGEGGIRTHGPLTRSRALQARLIDHSSTSPPAALKTRPRRGRAFPPHAGPPLAEARPWTGLKLYPYVRLSHRRPAFRLATQPGSRRRRAGKPGHRRNGVVVLRWRRGWDSNPRYACTHTAFRERHHQPLGHPSARIIAQAPSWAG